MTPLSRIRHADARPTIAVALHGIEPATFERCAVIRDWLGDHGVDRVTLLVIPARDLHPVGERSPAMVEWLCERRRDGDSIAQHGFQHVRPRANGSAQRLRARAHGQRVGEFVGLDDEETRRAVNAGWRLLKLAGIEPDGFVAPAYAYTPALRRTLSVRFSWWAGLLRVHRTQQQLEAGAWQGSARADDATLGAASEPTAGSLAPAWSLAGTGPLSRMLSPSLLRAGSLLPTGTLRLDVQPADLQLPRHMMALEWVLARSSPHRTAVTYRELAGVAPLAGRARRAPRQPLPAVNIAGSNDLTADSAA
jgi:predicted deacetylase